MGFLTNHVTGWATQHSTKLSRERSMLLNFWFSQIVCSSSWERGRSSSLSSTSTTTPPCESAFLNPTGSCTSGKNHQERNLYSGFRSGGSAPNMWLAVPAFWWTNTPITTTTKHTTPPLSLVSFVIWDMYNLTWSGRLLQLLCPCDHVFLLRSFHSGGECQVMSFGCRSWRGNQGRHERH